MHDKTIKVIAKTFIKSRLRHANLVIKIEHFVGEGSGGELVLEILKQVKYDDSRNL